jgi:hypothetical protein
MTGPNTGKPESGVVKKVQDGKTYATPSLVMHVTITPAVPKMQLRFRDSA